MFYLKKLEIEEQINNKSSRRKGNNMTGAEINGINQRQTKENQ